MDLKRLARVMTPEERRELIATVISEDGLAVVFTEAFKHTAKLCDKRSHTVLNDYLGPLRELMRQARRDDV